MSRIGKQPIEIPEKTTVTIDEDTIVVRGPLGELSRSFRDEIGIIVENGTVTLTRNVETIFSNALWGTYAAHIQNMISGVNTPFMKKLVIEGVGYKASMNGDALHMSLGFSHPVIVPIPSGLTVTVEKNTITIQGIDREIVGRFAAKVRAKKKPEPYKGKGIRYDGEVVRRKEGKKSA